MRTILYVLVTVLSVLMLSGRSDARVPVKWSVTVNGVRTQLGPSPRELGTIGAWECLVDGVTRVSGTSPRERRGVICKHPDAGYVAMSGICMLEDDSNFSTLGLQSEPDVITSISLSCSSFVTVTNPTTL